MERPFPALNEHVLLSWIKLKTAEQRPLEVCRRIDFAIDRRVRPLYRLFSHNVVTMETSAIGWPPWLITVWYLWILNNDTCTCIRNWHDFFKFRVSKCNQSKWPSNCIGFHGHHVMWNSSIVHSKKTEPWGVFDFFQMFSKIFQFSLFQCLKDAFVLLTFRFQVYSTFGKQLSFFRAKISGFAFSPTSKRSLQVCAVHIPFPRAARKGQSPMTLHCNCTGAMERGRQQKPRYVLVQKRIHELFFVKADVLFWKRSSFVYLEESVRVPSSPSPLRPRCRSWKKDRCICFWIAWWSALSRETQSCETIPASVTLFLKSVRRLPHYPTLKNDSHEAWKCSVTR